MTAHEYLMQAAALEALINSYIEEAERLRKLADTLPTLDLCRDRVKGGKETQSRMAEIVNRYVDLEAVIKSEIDTYVDLKDEIRNTIKTVSDMRLQTILRCKYLLFYSAEKTAEEVGLSPKQTARLHKIALKQVVVPEKYKRI